MLVELTVDHFLQWLVSGSILDLAFTSTPEIVSNLEVVGWS